MALLDELTRSRLSGRGGSFPFAAVGVTAVVGAACGSLVALAPETWRYLAAGMIAAVLLALVVRAPAVAIIATFAFLPFLALLRRLLIAEAVWVSEDPLLMVGPLVVVALCIHLFVAQGRPLASDHLSVLLVGLLGLTLLQVLNPIEAGGLARLQGLLFLAVPLLWFFVGRELGTRRVIASVLKMFVVSAAIVALYGLMQKVVGFPSWDEAWIGKGGYTALMIDDEIRPFGTFSSAAEYSLYLGGAVVVCLTMLLHLPSVRAVLRPFALMALALLSVALFLASGRAAIVLALAGALLVIGLRTRRLWLATLVVVVGLGSAAGAFVRFGPAFAQAASNSGDPLVAHQVSGLTDPLDPSESTLQLHWHLLAAGVRSGFENPLGYGTAATNLANRGSGWLSDRGTEVDVSNAFVALGALGGALYAIIVGVVLYRVLWRYRATGEWSTAAAAGVLVSSLGQWLIGGHYALTALTWFLIGSTARVREATADPRASSHSPAVPRAAGTLRRTASAHPPLRSFG